VDFLFQKSTILNQQ